MATARVLHFGPDDCDRVQELRDVGYDVCVSHSLNQLQSQLEGPEAIHAVMVEEGNPRSTRQAATLVRRRTAAPLILFRRTEVPLNLKRFDRVYSHSEPARHWLFDTAVLVEQLRMLEAQFAFLTRRTRQLLAETKEVVRQSRAQTERPAIELERDRGPSKPWHDRAEDKSK